MKKYLILGGVLLLLITSAVSIYNTSKHTDWLTERRIELLETALAPRTPDLAAYSWAEAIKTRNGAWQYAIMNDELRAQYLEQFEETNWVTGVSSPWVEKYRVTRESVDEKGDVTFKVEFDWYTSAGYAYSNSGILTVSKFENPDRWLLTYLKFTYEPDQGKAKLKDV
ncbi:MAG: hypothetical protein GXY34_02615 [Syntrophomonadaceae bacterium]|nr:hypothetical protein [Syntrophomonadaceae bacterium]